MKNIAFIVWITTVILIMGLLYLGAKEYGPAFALGLLIGTALTQLAVKARYGEWF